MRFDSTDEYEEWVEGIARVWHEDFGRTEPLGPVVEQCVVSYAQPEEGEATLRFGGHPWTEDRMAPVEILTTRDGDIPTGAAGIDQAAHAALMGDIVSAADRIENEENVSVGDVIAFDRYHDGDRRHEVDEPVVGAVVKIATRGTLRVHGIGSVDVQPEDVVEVVNPSGGEADGDA